MESGDHAPKPEDVPLPDTDEIGLHEDDPLETNLDDETFFYNEKYRDYLRKFNTLKTNEFKIENDPTLKLPTLEPIRNNTIQELKSMRKDIFDNLYEKYLDNDSERKKILANKDSFKPFETKNEDIQDFIELSKSISQLEKGIYSETGKELMFLLGEKESTPTKDTLKKILDYLKEKKYPFLFTLLAAGLIGFFVDLESQLNKASKKIKQLIANQLMKKLKNELNTQLLKAGDATVETVKKYLLHTAIIIVIAVIIYYKM